MNIAIIPARGGSKRIPRKNIKLFEGKPIIAYSIEAAIKSNLYDEVMVSTDDKEIAEIAISYGASVPFMRSYKNSDDFATTYSVLEEVINEYKFIGKEFETACCIYPCSPLIKSKNLAEAYNMLSAKDVDSVFPVVEYTTPIQRALIFKFGIIDFLYPENINKRSQDLEKTYYDAGQFYWFKIKPFLIQKSVLLKKNNSIQLNQYEVQDIDNEVDWEIAELKYRVLTKRELF